jgi:hypothetical protein
VDFDSIFPFTFGRRRKRKESASNTKRERCWKKEKFVKRKSVKLSGHLGAGKSARRSEDRWRVDVVALI